MEEFVKLFKDLSISSMLGVDKNKVKSRRYFYLKLFVYYEDSVAIPLNFSIKFLFLLLFLNFIIIVLIINALIFLIF